MQNVPRCQLSQFVVGAGAPEKVRQPRGQRPIVEFAGMLLEKQKPGGDQHGAEGHPHRVLESLAIVEFSPSQFHVTLNFTRRDRPAECARREFPQDVFRSRPWLLDRHREGRSFAVGLARLAWLDFQITEQTRRHSAAASFRTTAPRPRPIRRPRRGLDTSRRLCPTERGLVRRSLCRMV